MKGVTMLKSGAEVPYVIGVIDGEDPMGGIGAMMQQVAKQSAGAKSGSPLSGMASLFTAGHTYYRGTLKRVEAEPVMLPVLLDGVRISLPAVHAQGTIANGDKAIQAQFWWLDSAGWPVTLEWSLIRDSHKASQQVTKIDRPAPDTGPKFGGIADALRSPATSSCRASISIPEVRYCCRSRNRRCGTSHRRFCNRNSRYSTLKGIPTTSARAAEPGSVAETCAGRTPGARGAVRHPPREADGHGLRLCASRGEQRHRRGSCPQPARGARLRREPLTHRRPHEQPERR